MFHYFVCYIGRDTEGNVKEGNTEATLDYPVQHIEDVRLIEETIKKQFNMKSIQVKNYILLRIGR